MDSMAKPLWQTGAGGVLAGLAVGVLAIVGLMLANPWGGQGTDGATGPEAAAAGTETQTQAQTSAETQRETQTETPAPAAAPAATPEPAPAVDAAGAPGSAAQALPPRLSVARVAADGQTTLAGQAAPGATVEVVLDGQVIATVQAGGDGGFVAFADLPASDAPRVLSVQQREGAGHLVSPDQVLVQPVTTPAPVSVPAPVVVDVDVDMADAAPAQPGTPAATPASAAAESPSPDTPSPDTPSPDAPAMSAPTPAPTPAAPLTTVVTLTDEGLRLRPAPRAPDTPPEVMSSVALDSIGYTDTGQVALSGRGASGPGEGFVRVYLDNRPVRTGPIAPDGSWQMDLPAVDTGVYTLRVDQLDDQGRVTSRVESPFLREDPAVLRDPGAPADADAVARVVTVQPGSTLWAIARDRYGEGTMYLRVFEANRDRIRNPDLIYPGQVFDLPR